MANLLRASGLRLVASPVIPFDTPGLENGIRFAYVHAGTLIYDLRIDVPTAFDGTTPFGDIGLYQGGDTSGFFNAQSLTVDLSLGDVADSPVKGVSLAANATYLGGVYGAGNENPAAFRVTTAGPLFVVASQDATKGGAAVGGAAGELVAWAVLAG